MDEGSFVGFRGWEQGRKRLASQPIFTRSEQSMYMRSK